VISNQLFRGLFDSWFLFQFSVVNSSTAWIKARAADPFFLCVERLVLYHTVWWFVFLLSIWFQCDSRRGCDFVFSVVYVSFRFYFSMPFFLEKAIFSWKIRSKWYNKIEMIHFQECHFFYVNFQLSIWFRRDSRLSHRVPFWTHLPSRQGRLTYLYQ